MPRHWADRNLRNTIARPVSGPAPPEILAAWRRRFKRLPMMKAYFGVKRFHQITVAFLDLLQSPDHQSTAAVVMVQAERPP
jgi:hypothetical protein